MPKSPEEMANAMVKNMKEKTGKTLAQWLKICQAAKLEKHGQLVKHLKAEHGVTHGYANMIAHEALNPALDAPADDDLVAGQYAGAKAPLRSIYDAIIEKVTAFGGDVEIAPKKAYVSLRRAKQFGLIQPSTAKRVDVGIQCKDVSPTERLEASGSFNAMVSHRVRITAVEDVDEELIGWLQAAYEMA